MSHVLGSASPNKFAAAGELPGDRAITDVLGSWQASFLDLNSTGCVAS